MKILNKSTDESTTKNSSCFTAVKDLLFDAVVRAIPVCSLIFMLFLFWPTITRTYDNIFGSWETKIISKTYPVSHIRITHESDYYDDNQKNAGYALVNYKALPEKYLSQVKYRLLKLSRVNYLEFPDKKVLVNTDSYKRPFYLESDTDTVTILIKK